MICKNCGENNPEASKYCRKCGQSLLDTDPVSTPLAPTWGTVQGTGPEGTCPQSSRGLSPKKEFAVRYAGFWKRFAAKFIDGLVKLPFIMLLGFAHGMWNYMIRSSGSSHLALTSFVFMESLAITFSWLYDALLESSPWQATLGKTALGIKVTDLHGNRITFGRATARHFGGLLSAITLCIGYLMIAFTEKQQGLHDIMAGTLVVEK